MSTKHVRTAADLVRFGADLKIECGSCGNTRTLDGFDVARTLGTNDFSLSERRLRCFRCGAKGAKLTVLPPPPGPG